MEGASGGRREGFRGLIQYLYLLIRAAFVLILQDGRTQFQHFHRSDTFFMLNTRSELVYTMSLIET